MTCSPGERSKATVGLGLEGDYHSPDSQRGRDPQREVQLCKGRGCGVVRQERASEGRRGRFIKLRDLSPQGAASHRDGKEPVERVLFDSEGALWTATRG